MKISIITTTFLYATALTLWSCINFESASAASRNNDRESTLSKLIYQKIHGARGCFRRMNGTHQIGCSSGFNGDVGVVHLVETNSSIEWILSKGPHSPYIVLLKPQSFTLNVLQRLQSVEGRVSGVLLLKDQDIIDQFSTDSKCPNHGYGFYKKNPVCHSWNEPGSDIMFQDWQFPIFYVDNNESIYNLIDCYDKFNRPNTDGSPRDWPLCGAELHELMLAAVNSETCIRRNNINAFSITPSRLCDPIGDLNIHSTLIPSSQAEPFSKKGNRSVIVIGARMDASSFFDRISPGADSAATGLTSVLTLIKQLAPLKDIVKQSSKISNIYFVLFNGEAFDYTGSSRVVYDIMAEQFPAKVETNTTTLPSLLNLEDIKYYIELGQIAPSATSEYFIHRNLDSQFDNSSELDKLIEILQRNAVGGIKLISVQKDNEWWGVPPSSLQSFLKQDPNFPGIVIANHHKEFNNKYYNSIYDDTENINYSSNKTSPVVQEIANLVATITGAIEEIVKEKVPSSKVASDTELVNYVLECYVESARCKLFQNISGLTEKGLPSAPFPLYVGVYGHPNDVTHFTMSVMAYFQGTILNRTEADCKHLENDTQNMEFYWMNGDCYITTTRTSPAVSPVFTDIVDYDWKSNAYPTWTESVWTLQSMTDGGGDLLGNRSKSDTNGQYTGFIKSSSCTSLVSPSSTLGNKRMTRVLNNSMGYGSLPQQFGFLGKLTA